MAPRLALSVDGTVYPSVAEGKPVQVYDVLGRQVVSARFPIMPHELRHFPPGIYLMKVNEEAVP